MGSFQVVHEIDCDVATFWKLFFDKELQVELFTKELGYPGLEILEQEETESGIRRRLRAFPKTSIPPALAKLFKSTVSYVEEGTFDRASSAWRWKAITSTMPDKLLSEGVIRAEPVGDSRCRRVCDSKVEARIFAVGSQIERQMEQSLRLVLDTSAAVYNRRAQKARG